MNALVYRMYGGPEVLNWQNVPIPEPAPHEVLVAVKASSINPSDVKLRNGQFKTDDAPFAHTMGMDVAGIVAKAGSDVSDFKLGDKVAGYTGAKGGGFADYAIVQAAHLFKIPADMSYAEAASLPMNAGTALVVTKRYVKPLIGQEILINGAAGGLGLFLVRYALNAGATVSGTGSGSDSEELLTALGIDAFIDFKTTNVLQVGKQYDTVVDTSGKLDFEQGKAMLKEHGTFVTMVPKTDPSRPGRTDGNKQELLVNAVPGPEEIAALAGMASTGEIRAFVGKTYPMTEAVTALRDVESGKLSVTGKVVLVK